MTSEPAELQWLFDARVWRILRPHGQRMRESFQIVHDGGEEWLQPGDVVIETYPLIAQHKRGPIAIYDAPVGSADIADAYYQRSIEKNLERNIVSDAIVEAVDVGSVEPMSDDVFWQLVAELRGTVSVAGLNRLSRKLVASGLPACESFHVALALKLRAIDHPDNSLRTRIAGRDVLNADATLYMRCRIVAAGHEAFESLRLDPGSIDQWRKGRVGEGLLTVASDAVSTLSGEVPVTLVGAPSFETGTNEDLWPDVDPGEKYVFTPMSNEAFLASIQKDLDRFSRWPLGDPWQRADLWGTDYTVRYVSKSEDLTYETMQVVVVDMEMPTEGNDREVRSRRDAIALVHESVRRAGREVVGAIEAYKSAPLHSNSELIATRYRWAGSTEEYLAQVQLFAADAQNSRSDAAE